MVKKRTSSSRQRGLQAKKSASTRKATLKAAIDCFVERGYAGTSTKIIAQRAGVSRGAMIHHFPTKHELLKGAVEYLIDERITSFVKAIKKLKEADRQEQDGIDIYWRHLNTRLFVVYHELTVAARTDPELNAVMKKATRRFEQRWFENIRQVFPEWEDTGELFELAMDISQFMMEGMALNRLARNVKQRQRRIREYLKARLKDMLAAGQQGNHDRAVRQFLARGKS